MSVPHPQTLLGWTVLVTLLVVIGWLLYARAVRVDRLHRQVLGARATLEAQLVHRAQAALELATSGLLDPASGLLLAQAARESLDCESPLVDDGLEHRPPGAGASPGPTSSTPPTGADPAAGDGEDRPRARVESDLSRVIRTVLHARTRALLADDPRSAEVLARLDRAAYRVVLARRFHDTRVAQAQRLRADLVVRLLHLAGRAPVPQTFDVDDDTGPAGAAGA